MFVMIYWSSLNGGRFGFYLWPVSGNSHIGLSQNYLNMANFYIPKDENPIHESFIKFLSQNILLKFDLEG